MLGEAWLYWANKAVRPVVKTTEAVIEVGQWVRQQAEHVPSLGMTEKEIEDYQHRLHDAEEKKQADAAAEQDDLVKGDTEPTKEEVEDYLTSTGGSSGSGPINEQPYMGEYPSFPTSLTNGPPPYDPQIIIEPIGSATTGY